MTLTSTTEDIGETGLMGLLKNKRGNAVLVNCTSKIHNYRLIRIVDRRNGRRGNCT